MIIDHIRDLEEFRRLYESRPMPNQYDFDFLVNNPNLFCFYAEDGIKELRGYITVQVEDGELTLSGASVRKNMPDNIDAIICVCNAFNRPIYSYTYKKAAELVLRKAGFKKISTNTIEDCSSVKKYMRYKNGQ